MSTFHVDEYDEQALIKSDSWKYRICDNLVLSNDIGEKYITIIINNTPEWRKVFVNKEKSYVIIGTENVSVNV